MEVPPLGTDTPSVGGGVSLDKTKGPIITSGDDRAALQHNFCRVFRNGSGIA